ncbi:MAG: transporter substrate-binding domain-containing protein [Pseudomonadota bacterium]
MKVLRWMGMGVLALIAAIIATPSQADQLSDIQKQGQIKVGVSLFQPWTLQGKSGLMGFEIDVARKMAADLGVTPVFIVVPWKDILTRLENGDIDIIAGGISVTAQRALRIAFSAPYSSDGTALAANLSLTGAFKGLADFNQPEVTLAVVSGTVYGDVARTRFARASFKEFAATEDAEAAVRSGAVHAYAGSVAKTGYLEKAFPDTLYAPLPTPLRQSKGAFAVQRGEPNFVNFLNAWLVEHEASGWLPDKRAYWFDSLAWAADVK